ncbi:hypothetical protein OKW24_001255 [Peribacillus simplex]|uniref:DUF4362 domain-containing protein n=1 Tax=Peribacillus simplex TaxID=1478 RepID=UPI0024E1A7DD|nr:DUF4362 domain-containing protein [Peribacillus simplex]MDF9759482.1 hypothetical protein [Peribacillus simplex]
MNFRKGYFILIVMLLTLLIDCSISLSENEDEQFTPAQTDIVSKHDGIENLTRLKDFIQNVSKGKEDKIRVVSYTKEGDPIISDITFNVETLEVTSDTTKDEYGDKTIKTHQCKTIEVIKNENNQDEYVLKGCSGYEIPYYLGVD